MAERKYYCLCDSNCKFETLNKEQILTAIAQAVSEGKVGDIDSGFITRVKTINGTPLKFFVGAQSEYETLSEDDKTNLFAIITNDTSKESIENAIQELRNNYDDLTIGLRDGSFVVKEADHATSATNLLTSEWITASDGIVKLPEKGLYCFEVTWGDDEKYNDYYTVNSSAAYWDGKITSVLLVARIGTRYHTLYLVRVFIDEEGNARLQSADHSFSTDTEHTCDGWSNVVAGTVFGNTLRVKRIC